jgi:radical SAM-linked protein
MYVGHRDLLRFVHRVLRRAQVPFAVSGGFSPKPRTIFGPALPLGVLAEHEPLDVELRDGVYLDVVQVAGTVSRLIDAALPRDFVISLAVLKPEDEPLNRAIAAAQYRLSYVEQPEAQFELLGGDEPLPLATAKGEYDARPAIENVEAFARDIIVTAALGVEHQLNVVRLAELLKKRTGVAPLRLCRECFLSHDGLPL